MSALIRTTSGMPGPGSDRAAALSGVAPALRSLRQATSLPRLFRHATRALCDEMGFGRAALFSLRDHALVAESVHVRGAPDEGSRLLKRLAGAPAPLGPSLHESEVLRRRTTLLVEDAVGDRACTGTPPRHAFVRGGAGHLRGAGRHADARRPRPSRAGGDRARAQSTVGVRRRIGLRARAMRARGAPAPALGPGACAGSLDRGQRGGAHQPRGRARRRDAADPAGAQPPACRSASVWRC